MNCERVLLLLSAYIDDEVSPEDVQTIEQHLAVCPSCAQELEAMRRTAGILANLEEVEPPPAFLERLEAATVRRPRFWARLGSVLRVPIHIPRYTSWAAAGLAVALILGLLIAYNSTNQHPVPRTTITVQKPNAYQPEKTVIVAQPDAGVTSPAPVTRYAGSLHNGRPVKYRTRQPARPLTPKASIVPATTPAEPVEEELVPEPDATETVTVDVPEVVPEEKPVETVVVREPEPVPEKPAANVPSPDVKIKEKLDMLEKLHRRPNLPVGRKGYDSRIDSMEGGRYSVELASIRF